jgi:undecaprenyl-diphosphatase
LRSSWGFPDPASTIIGGLLTGLDCETATSFSFYLALPTLGIATVFDLLSNLKDLSSGDLVYPAVGAVVTFFVAYLVVGWLLRYISNHYFKAFGISRIIVGVVILIFFRS